MSIPRMMRIPSLPNYYVTEDGKIFEWKEHKVSCDNRGWAYKFSAGGKMYFMPDIMRQTYFKGCKGSNVIHKNGAPNDWSVRNLKFISKSEHGKIYAQKKVVEKVHPATGEVVEVYPSVRSAANMVGVSVNTMRRKIKNHEYYAGHYWRTEQLEGRPRKEKI